MVSIKPSTSFSGPEDLPSYQKYDPAKAEAEETSDSKDDKPDTFVFRKRKVYALLVSLGIVLILLLISTVAFAALYFHLSSSNNNKLPKWPKPSISPMGKYTKAGVAADNEYCSEVGRNVLLQQGNAVDAAIAALFCIGVMDSHSAGIGGGHFMTIYNASSQSCHVVDAREMAPALATEDMYKDRWNDSQIGWRAVAVPGELHGMWTEYSRFGSGAVSWSSLIQPTIQLLKEGYPTSYALATALKDKRDWVLYEPTMKAFINPTTKDVYKEGEQITTRETLTATLQKIAEPPAGSDPVKLFYTDMAETMVAEFSKNGGLLSKEDFAKYASIVRSDNDVIMTRLPSGRSMCGPPPPAGSAVAQGILNVMDGYEHSLSSFDSTATFYHRFIEASKFAYASRSQLGDSAFVANATAIAKNITTPEWANYVRSKITDKTHPDAYYGGTFEGPAVDHGTTHISVIDKDGNAVSVTSTINLLLGAMVSSESTGILWNDEMDDFSLPGHPNYFGYPPSPANFIRPGKRPQSSMSPIVIFDNDKKKRLMAVGGAGGSTIISGVAGVALHALWLGENVKQAVDLPRLHNQLQPNVTHYETGFPQAYLDDLSSRGHTFVKDDNFTVATTVERAADGNIYANSDFRKGDESGPAGY